MSARAGIADRIRAATNKTGNRRLMFMRWSPSLETCYLLGCMISREMVRSGLIGAISLLVGSVSTFGAASTTAPAQPVSPAVDVFVSGQEGCHTYRIVWVLGVVERVLR